MSDPRRLENSWQRAWAALGLVPSAGLLDQVMRAWSEPRRRYHSLQHLGECIDLFSQARGLADHPGEVELALWFHDAVYDTQGSGNEERSADWALQALQGAASTTDATTAAAAGATADVQARVQALILATRHDALPAGKDQQLLVDIDLAILGAAPQRFAEYDQQVRAEYAWVPEDLYRAKRREVLAMFAQRDPLYGNAFFRQRLQGQARTNLQAALAALT